MPLAVRRLTLAQAKETVAAAALSGECSGRVGLEVEAFPDRPHAEVVASLGPLAFPGGSRLTFEPGGQVELSGPCLPTADAACAAMVRDLAAARSKGVALSFEGMCAEPRQRVLELPRYAAMEAYFDRLGPDGRRMMRDTAALQVNVDAGDDRRWRLAHALGPVLAAAFANSPDRATGARSARLATWQRIDPSRTAAVGGRTIGAWVDYALAARVMFVRSSPDDFHPVREPMSMADWINSGHALGWPSEDDLAYHLTTLFPPVRARGWLELRFFDSLPAPWWQAAVAAVTTLFDDAAASGAAEEACGSATASLWPEAARSGLDHPVLGDAAEACLRAAASASGHPGLGEFVERYTLRRRCPADDALVAAWR
jgi:glutamate--cysteine ligase